MWCWEIDLPEGLFDEPLLGGFFRDFCGVGQFFNSSDDFPVALRAVVDFGELDVHR